MKKKKRSFLEGVISVLSSQTFKTFLENLIIKILKLQASGGIKIWLIKLLAKEFTSDVIDIIDYVDIRNKVNDTVNQEDRDEATDTLNDIMH